MTRLLLRRVAGFVALAGLSIALVACSKAGGGAGASAGAGHIEGCPSSQPPVLGAGETRTVTLATEKGDITMALDSDLSPIAVANFVALASCGYYDGTGFHRVVPKFVIQGGDPTGTGAGGPGYTIKDEPITTPYARGTVAMARTSEPDSVGSQFFIVTDDKAAAQLSAYNTYQIIGEVTSGMEVADAITKAADKELPTQPVKINKVTVANP